MPVPTERINLLRIRKKHTLLPCYSADMVGFAEMTQTGMRFGDLWYETAKPIDEIEGLNRKRPYLDQMALPRAIQRSGFRWHPDRGVSISWAVGGVESPCPITNWRPFTIAGRNF